ncbi:MAG: TraR/DksA family transcriptional regulator [Deltaproteobacteria bacterium]|nr:TraR/DksA family transcriptional regulator [Deltaproteobacteria bacterium]MCW5801022.1 TraR/DksA family transcriptional regulator [Deltaproteobacteria bacterium]
MRRRRELLLRYRDELDRADEELSERQPEDVQRATELWDATVLAHLGESDARALLEVVQALRRLDTGDYGVCVTCGEDIAPARLDALPTAATCIECATIGDRDRRHRRDLRPSA